MQHILEKEHQQLPTFCEGNGRATKDFIQQLTTNHGQELRYQTYRLPAKDHENNQN